MSAVTADQLQSLINEALLRDVGTSGSIIFLDANKKIVQDNANLFFDAVNGYLGVGTTSPQAKVDSAISSSSVAALGARQSTAAGPALFIAGHATADVLTETLVSGASVTTATKAAFVRVNVKDDNSVVTAGNYYLELFTIT